MIWLTQRERVTLTALGGLALAGLGVTLWQQRRAPLTIELGFPPPYTQWQAMLQESKLVDLNRATASELERLPEVGPSLAQRIIDYRQTHGPFRAPEELHQVPGIGPKTYDVLKDYITAR